MGLDRQCALTANFIAEFLARLAEPWESGEPNWTGAEWISHYLNSETSGTWSAGIAQDLSDAIRRRDPWSFGDQLLAARAALEISSCSRR